jgi:hypothetical protein
VFCGSLARNPQLARDSVMNLRVFAARPGFPRGRGKLRPGRARSPGLTSVLGVERFWGVDSQCPTRGDRMGA